MFAPTAVAGALKSSLVAVRLPLGVVAFGAVAWVCGVAVGWALALAVAWALGAGISSGAIYLCQPSRWAGTGLIRGVHPGRCALTIEVEHGEEQRARALGQLLSARQRGALFFARAPDHPELLIVASLGHELGLLNEQNGVLPWRRTRPWRLRGRKHAVGWSVSLRPGASRARSARVVATDIVRVSAVTTPDMLARWLDEWDSRAVAASTLSACLSSPA